MYLTDFLNGLIGATFFLVLLLFLPYLLSTLIDKWTPDADDPATIPSDEKNNNPYFQYLRSALASPDDWKIHPCGRYVRLEHTSKLFTIIDSNGEIQVHLHTAPHASIDIFPRPWVFDDRQEDASSFHDAVHMLLITKTLSYIKECEHTYQHWLDHPPVPPSVRYQQ